MVRLVLLSMLVAACGGESKPKPAESAPPKLAPAERERLAECRAALEAIAVADPPLRMRLLATGCGAALPGFAELSRVDASQQALILARDSDLFCNPRVGADVAAAAPEDKLALLVAGCGAGYFGLAAGQEALMSQDWFVVQRVGAWLAKALAAAKAAGEDDLVAACVAAMAPVRIALPVPAAAPARYELPAAAHGAPTDAPAFVLIGADALTMAATPSAVLTPEGARMTGELPGAAVALDELDARLAAVAPAPAAARPRPKPAKPDEPAEPAAADKPRAVARARNAGVLAVLNSEPSGTLEDLTDGDDLWPDSAAPLLVADRALPAHRLLEVAEALETRGARLAVAAGGVAGEHGVRFGARARPGTARVRVALEDDGASVQTASTSVSIPKVAGAYDTAALEQALLAIPDRGAVLNLAAGAQATVAELAATLDVVRDAGFKFVVVGPFGTIGSGMGTIGHGPGYPGPRPTRRPAAPVVGVGSETVSGDIDKEMIRKYIRQNTPRLQYCYQKRLVDKPALQGKVTAKFTINPEGLVIASTATGIGDAELEACIAGVIRNIRFPKIGGDKPVTIIYPFVFKPAP